MKKILLFIIILLAIGCEDGDGGFSSWSGMPASSSDIIGSWILTQTITEESIKTNETVTFLSKLPGEGGINISGAFTEKLDVLSPGFSSCENPSHISVRGGDGENTYGINLNSSNSDFSNWTGSEYFDFSGSPESISYNEENYTLSVTADTLVNVTLNGNNSTVYASGVLIGKVVSASSSGYTLTQQYEVARDDYYIIITFEENGEFCMTSEEQGTMCGEWSMSSGGMLTLSAQGLGDSSQSQVLKSGSNILFKNEERHCEDNYELSCYDQAAYFYCGLDGSQINNIINTYISVWSKTNSTSRTNSNISDVSNTSIMPELFMELFNIRKNSQPK